MAPSHSNIFLKGAKYGKKNPAHSSKAQKAKDKAGLIKACIDNTITQKQAATMLQVSERQVRRMVSLYRDDGPDALIHKGIGKPSNHQLPDDRKEQAVELFEKKYSDMGPTLVADMLGERDNISICPETLRRELFKRGLWEVKSQTSHQHRRWRDRRPCFGELAGIDTCKHQWFADDPEYSYIISMVDDDTSTVFAQMYEGDTTENNMRLIKSYIEQNGRPIALYSDQATLFKVTEKALQKALKASTGAFKPEPKTQIKRALDELGIGLIFARSPQAKGRVERSFGTLQNRLVQLMRLDNITTIDAANQYLTNYYLPKHNKAFRVEPTSSFNAHRDYKGFDLDAILSIQEERVVQNDFTISYKGKCYQIEAAHYQGKLRKERITLEERLDGTLRARFNNQYFIIHLIR
jgi:transposase